MNTSPPIADSSDRPTTGPLVIGPVRGLWEIRDLDFNPWTWIVVFGPWAPLLAVGFLEDAINPMPGDHRTSLLTFSLMMAYLVGVTAFVFSASAWGDACWRINGKGVSHTPPRREPTFLAWDDVERVKLLGSITLRGRGVKILLPVTLPEADRREAARRIRERLGDDFDLEPRPRPQASIGSFLRLLAIGLVTAAVLGAMTFGPVLIQDFGGPRIAWIGRTAFFCWMFLFLAGLVTFLRYQVMTADWVSRRSAIDGFHRQSRVPE